MYNNLFGEEDQTTLQNWSKQDENGRYIVSDSAVKKVKTQIKDVMGLADMKDLKMLIDSNPDTKSIFQSNGTIKGNVSNIPFSFNPRTGNINIGKLSKFGDPVNKEDSIGHNVSTQQLKNLIPHLKEYADYSLSDLVQYGENGLLTTLVKKGRNNKDFKVLHFKDSEFKNPTKLEASSSLPAQYDPRVGLSGDVISPTGEPLRFYWDKFNRLSTSPSN